ncbi:hypothetical protein EI555_019660, partial [Monodon monoceros]
GGPALVWAQRGKGWSLAVAGQPTARDGFPLRDSKCLIQLLKAVQKDNWTPTNSEHFTKESFSTGLEDEH